MNGSFDGRSVIVTGGAQGIGAAVATAFAHEGATTFLVDLDADRAETLASSLRDRDLDATALVVDVTDTDAVNRMASQVQERTGRIDVLVTSAGGFSEGILTEDIGDAQWAHSIDLNLGHVFRCCRAVIPSMKAAGYGRIITVSSEGARMPLTRGRAKNFGPYLAAKAGVIGFTRHLARELGPDGITANVVAPGTTLSERVRGLHSPEAIDRLAELTPLQRLAEPDDHVGPILFLASDAAQYVNGGTLDSNGGRVML